MAPTTKKDLSEHLIQQLGKEERLAHREWTGAGMVIGGFLLFIFLILGYGVEVIIADTSLSQVIQNSPTGILGAIIMSSISFLLITCGILTIRRTIKFRQQKEKEFARNFKPHHSKTTIIK